MDPLVTAAFTFLYGLGTGFLCFLCIDECRTPAARREDDGRELDYTYLPPTCNYPPSHLDEPISTKLPPYGDEACRSRVAAV